MPAQFVEEMLDPSDNFVNVICDREMIATFEFADTGEQYQTQINFCQFANDSQNTGSIIDPTQMEAISQEWKNEFDIALINFNGTQN